MMTITSSTPTVSPIAQIEALYDRLSKAKALLANGKVSPVYGIADHYIVEGSNAKYLVNGECLCPDATNRSELLKGFCKHRFAALLYAEQTAQTSKPKATPTTAESSERDEGLEHKVSDLYR
jgi:hypothetical protein